MKRPSFSTMQSRPFASNPSTGEGSRSMQSACKEQTLRSEHAKQSLIYIFALRTTLLGGQVAGWSKSLPPATIYLSFACRGNTSFKKKNFNPRLCFVQVGQTKQLKGKLILW